MIDDASVGVCDNFSTEISTFLTLFLISNFTSVKLISAFLTSMLAEVPSAITSHLVADFVPTDVLPNTVPPPPPVLAAVVVDAALVVNAFVVVKLQCLLL